MGRIDREKKTITCMLSIYCHDHHQGSHELCADCLELRDYAFRRLDVCPFQDKKPACNKCTVHCYSAAKKEKIKQVMRYAGPRMALKHPLLSIFHFVDLLAGSPELKKKR